MNDSLDRTEKTPYDLETGARGTPVAVAALSPQRAARGTRTALRALPPPIPARARRSTSMPPLPAPTPPRPAPISVVATAGGVDLDPESDAATEYFDRTEPPTRRSLGTIGGIVAGVIVVGVVLGIGLGGDASDNAAQTAPMASPRTAIVTPNLPKKPLEPAIPQPRAPIAAPTPAAPRTVIVALPITSVPAGASVTLIGGGVATVIGKTPVTASIDPARSYDVVFALRDHATKLSHVEPRTTNALTVDLSDPPPPPRTTSVPTSKTSRPPGITRARQ